MEPLPDGIYDGMIIEVESDERRQVRIDVVLTTEPHRGEVVSLRASAMRRDPLDLMGLPARLRVDDGTPRLEMD